MAVVTVKGNWLRKRRVGESAKAERTPRVQYVNTLFIVPWGYEIRRVSADVLRQFGATARYVQESKWSIQHVAATIAMVWLLVALVAIFPLWIIEHDIKLAVVVAGMLAAPPGALIGTFIYPSLRPWHTREMFVFRLTPLSDTIDEEQRLTKAQEILKDERLKFFHVEPVIPTALIEDVTGGGDDQMFALRADMLGRMMSATPVRNWFRRRNKSYEKLAFGAIVATIIAFGVLLFLMFVIAADSPPAV